MPLYTEKVAGPAFTADDIDYGTGEVLAAQAAETMLDAPLLSAIPRAIELDTARKRYGGAYENFDKAGALGWLSKQGLTEADLPLEDRTYNALELSILAKRKVAEIRRNQVLERGTGGVAQGAARLGTALGVSLLDPLNVASGFVPVIGEARYARILAQAGGKLGRAGARAGLGAVEGAAGAAALEPIIAGARLQELADHGAADSLLNIAFGGVFGGGLHVAGGAIGDALRPAARVSDELVAQAEIVAARQPDAPAVAAEVVPPAARSPDIPDAYFDDATTLRRALVAARDLDINDPDALAKVLGSRPKPLSQFVKDSGGIFDKGGELEARDITNKSLPGLVRKQPGRENEATLDAVKLRAFEAGYFPRARDYNDISDSELLDVLADDLSGSRRYPASAEDAITRVRADQDFVEAMAVQGITRDMDAGAIAARLRDLDEEARARSAEAAGVDADTLAEYDASAAKLVGEASEAQRGEALRVAVAQAVNGEPIEVRAAFGQAPAREAVARVADADAHPLADRAALERADQAVTDGDVTDPATLQKQVDELDEELKAMQDDAELEGEAGDAMRAAIEAVDEALAPLEKSTRDLSQAARLMGVCASRNAA